MTDFGIARSLDVQHGMTQTGTVLGTSDYIAPEQAQGQRVDEHTDVYSLGVVLYELLTSEVPFPGENFVAVAMRHINEAPPSIRDKRPDVSPRLEAAIQRAMAKDAADRFPTMADFCQELDACLAEAHGTQVAPAVRPKRSRAGGGRRRGISPWPLILLLAALLAIGAVVAALLIHGTGSGSSTTTTGGAAAGTPHLRAVAADDRFGTGGEHDADVGKATDNNPSTYWTTEDYRSAPSLGKPGVGLVLDASRPVELRELGIATGTPGFTAVIRAGNSPDDRDQGDLVVADRERRHDVRAPGRYATATTRSGSPGSAAATTRPSSTKSGHPERVPPDDRAHRFAAPVATRLCPEREVRGRHR